MSCCCCNKTDSLTTTYPLNMEKYEEWVQVDDWRERWTLWLGDMVIAEFVGEVNDEYDPHIMFKKLLAQALLP